MPSRSSRRAGAAKSWFNRRGAADTFALTASDAYEWHRHCPCQGPRPLAWCQVSGRGEEGDWARSWLDWLSRTHLEPKAFVVVGTPSSRMIEIQLPVETESVPRLRDAVSGGNRTAEPAPSAPASIMARDQRR